MNNDRRSFLKVTTAFGVGVIASSRYGLRGEEKKNMQDQNEHAEEAISATEDLMREHGVLNRVLLVYQEGLRRLRSNEEVPPEVFHATASLVRKFVEDYHEKLEETYIFPEFEKQKKLTDLVATLRTQHQAGRKVTDVILRNAVADRFAKVDARQEIIRSCEAFIRMYRPHEAREDTVLFPALRKIVPAKRIDELGEQFEEQEHRFFGEEGFDRTVEQVASIERQLGIYDLAQFTAK